MLGIEEKGQSPADNRGLTLQVPKASEIGILGVYHIRYLLAIITKIEGVKN